MPLTDTHLVLLSAASQQDDGLLPRPDRLVGIALQRVETTLLKAGLVEPVGVRADQPHWRRDEADTPVGLRITAAGLAAIGIDHGARGEEVISDIAAPPAPAARPSSKIATLRAMLASPDGATVEALVTALGWQPHTVRAALTRLRQSGLTITGSRTEGNVRVYRSTPGVGEPTTAVVDAITTAAQGEVA